MKKLNEKEQAVFDYVCKISAKQGYAPSVRDICAALQYKSTSTVQMYLDRLLEYGYLCREAGKNRSLRPAMGVSGSVTAREIPIAVRTERGILTEDCFVGTLPLFLAEEQASADLFAFRLQEEASLSQGKACFGIADPKGTVSVGDRVLFSNPKGEIFVAPWQETAQDILLGKLIAAICIL